MRTPNITLYTDNTPNRHKIRIILKERSFPHKLKALEWITARRFLKINPNRQIPTLTDSKRAAFSFSTFAPVHYNYMIKKSLSSYKNLLRVLKYRLKELSYLTGEKYMIGDIMSFVWPVQSAAVLDFDLAECCISRCGQTRSCSRRLSRRFKVILHGQREVLIKRGNSDKH
ncbi:hypothetical protein BDV10DRAFT_195882 [Aspergillus recurvatus]